MMMSEVWYERIRQLRVKANLTQQQLADRAGIALAQVGRLERGLLEPRIYDKVARSLGVPVSYLLGELLPIEAFVAMAQDNKHGDKLARHLLHEEIVQACYVSSNLDRSSTIMVKLSFLLFDQLCKFLLGDCIVMRLEKSLTWLVLKRYDQPKSKEMLAQTSKDMVHGMVLLTVDYKLQDAVASEIADLPGVLGAYAVTGKADLLVHCGSSSASELKQVLDRMERIPSVRTELRLEDLLESR